MFLFRRETPRHFYAPGADPTLDRPIPQKAGGLPCMVIVLIVMVILFAGTLYLLNQQNSAKQVIWVTETPGGPVAAAEVTELATFAPTATLDGWALTGTALFFATTTPTPTNTPNPDWCYFLTPSPVYLPTIYVTPDAAQLAATALALSTGTPTPTPQPTDAPPRAWCNSYIPGPDAAAMTTTARAWPTAGRLPSIAPPATFTPVPAIAQPAQPAPAQPTQLPPLPTDAPPPQIIVVTSPPQVIIIEATGQPVIITATLQNTGTPTPTATATETSTDLPTATATETSTDIPTATETATATPTPTPTETATNLPTEEMTQEASP